MPTTPSLGRLNERSLVFVIGAVQFANILDFMMVMPLGPDFARELGISTAHLGYIGGAYTAAAAVAGVVGSIWLERFDRRTALVVATLGLMAGTAMGGMVNSLQGLIAARVLAGFCGGPATATAMSIIADVVPAERRGKAMGSVMGAFAAASVLGVPAGLELARRGSWRTPFFAVAALAGAVALAAWILLPKMTGHLRREQPATGLIPLLREPRVRLAAVMTSVVMVGAFCLIPNIASYLQLNLGFARDRLGGLYLFGGIVSFFATRAAGRMVDRFGSFAVGSVGAALLFVVVGIGYLVEVPLIPVEALFLAFFLAMAFRNVPVQTVMTLVPGPNERAAFLSLQSAVQHVAASIGAFASSQILQEQPDHRLAGMPKVAALSMAMTLLLPPLLWALERTVRRPKPVLAQ